MTALLIFGNTRSETFANAIVSAHLTSQKLFSKGLSYIYVINSSESLKHLNSDQSWINYISNVGLSQENIVSKLLDISPSGSSIEK
ncbi:MAG: hypothetical protein ABG776_13825, partial [Cyanobacteria bacterium J06555_13]